MSASLASKAGHTLAYSAIALATLATSAFTMLAAASSFGGSGGCGNTFDAIRTALYLCAPIGVSITFALWGIAYKCGARHPIGRTLSFLSLALWIFALLISRA